MLAAADPYLIAAGPYLIAAGRVETDSSDSSGFDPYSVDSGLAAEFVPIVETDLTVEIDQIAEIDLAVSDPIVGFGPSGSAHPSVKSGFLSKTHQTLMAQSKNSIHGTLSRS